MLLLLLASVLLVPGSVVGHDPGEDRAKCKAITDAAQRLECYDQLAGGSAAPASEAPAPAPGTTMVDPKTGITLAYIPAGTFLMGSPASEEGHRSNETQHQVTLGQPLWMGTTEVTNAQYRRFVEATGHREPSEYWDDSEYSRPLPVTMVSWDDAVAYASWAGMSLPTEAQWEYAARAGTTSSYWSGNDYQALARVGWYADNSEMQEHPVGKKPANAWGLHDVHGNVSEWTADWYGDYPSSSQTDPAGPDSGSKKVVRGGSWDDRELGQRAAYRNNLAPDSRSDTLGFRIVRTVASESTAHYQREAEQDAATELVMECEGMYGKDGATITIVGETLTYAWEGNTETMRITDVKKVGDRYRVKTSKCDGAIQKTDTGLKSLMSGTYDYCASMSGDWAAK